MGTEIDRGRTGARWCAVEEERKEKEVLGVWHLLMTSNA